MRTVRRFSSPRATSRSAWRCRLHLPPEGAKEGEVLIIDIRREIGDAGEEAKRIIE
ncbi:hypothetical protein [Methanoculleus taiwanensis]|uniref:hypothetical protein n=1 Tax=Methanoculleus taiwanensis TaxID=1550565 RepID=UPI0019D469E2|nr:hypothetical protein [Methanoculleus taiwanensis]